MGNLESSVRIARALVVTALALACACEEGVDASVAEETAMEELDFEGEQVDPPFDVSGDAEGLLLVWFDAEGLHTADSRAEIPEAHREEVRVDSLRLAPDERLDPAYVWVADLSAPGEGGAYPVRKLRREAFEALVDRETGVALARAERERAAPRGDPNADVIIYGAEWCGACNQAARFFESNDVAFVEKDIERDPGARQEMQDKARAAGVNPSGIPVIDFRGTLVTGFDQARLRSLIERGAAPI